RTTAVVRKGKTTSNAKIKWWMRKIKGIPQNSKDKISLDNIISATDAEKTLGKCHIEYHTLENGICGRSLEEAVMNVN
ncbi:UNVERIFIED_CONTAM: ATP-dependent endonuclease, partial [Bacteroidetes bacterium 56_B9]